MAEIISLILILAILFFSIIIHEYSHGRIAALLGDPTAKAAGRLTLNPLAHIDPFGTFILPITLFITTLQLGRPFAIGYARPVPINPANFTNPKKGMMWVGLAGPASNFILALIFSLLRAIITMPFLREIFAYAVLVNVILAVFNLIPIPPLDGSRVLLYFLPYKYASPYLKLERYGFLIILLLFFTRIIHLLVLPVISFILRLLQVPMQV